MDTGEFNKPPSPEEIEKVVTPEEFLELAVSYVTDTLVPQSQELSNLVSSMPNPLVDDPSYKNYIDQAAAQLTKDLPQAVKITLAAKSGQPVNIITRPAGSFFDLGERIDQNERPEETKDSKTFTKEQTPELVVLFHRTLENNTRQDATSIVGYAELLSMLAPGRQQQLDAIKNKALSISFQTSRIEDEAKKTLAGKPVKLTVAQGRQSLNLKHN